MVKCNVFEMKINYNMLDKSIDSYKKYNNGDDPNYIIMNYKTYNKVKRDSISDYYRGISLVGREGKEEYHGIPIAISSNLEDGDIDIV